MSTIDIRTSERRFPVAPLLHGLFIEDINRGVDGGLYAELLRNRAFEDSLPPEGVELSEDGRSFRTPTGWVGEFNGGEGKTAWGAGGAAEYPIPAWFAKDAVIALDTADTLNPQRRASIRVQFEEGGWIANEGFHGVPLRAGESYVVTLFARSNGPDATLMVALAGEAGDSYVERGVVVGPGEFTRIVVELVAPRDDVDAVLKLQSLDASDVSIGYTSLMKATDVESGGLRRDLVDRLTGLHPSFIRFPGGCVVEGFTPETALRFSHTIGPVWERPGQATMWFYRSTNGMGFHEYMQLCEQLDAEAVYVVNCGMTCQTRGGELFEGDELEELLQETLDAVEYAIGDASTPMGSKRAAAGRAEPFRLNYIEIGNENFGPDYETRYAMFHDALVARYPHLQFIANEHVERAGLPADAVGEHFYDTADFFAEATHRFDAYDRSGPAIFVGEYAVNAGTDAGNLRSALGESMFLLGVENNQDIVRMTSYAPLLENVDYVAWSPNLIAFDNHRTAPIPAYEALSMIAEHRGDHVVESTIESSTVSRQASGLPAIIARRGGLQFRNATINGEPVALEHVLQGSFVESGGVFTAIEDEDTGIRLPFPGAEELHRIVGGVFGGTPSQVGEFEIEVRSDDGVPFTLGVWTSAQRSGAEGTQQSWTIRTVDLASWVIDGSTSQVMAGRIPPVPLADAAPLELDTTTFHRYRVVTHPDGFDCFVDGALVQQARLPRHDSAMASATVTDSGDVIVKVVNIGPAVDDVRIQLDVPVEADYSVVLLTGERDAVNTLDSPDAVVRTARSESGAADDFVYQAPAYSLSILTLRTAEV